MLAHVRPLLHDGQIGGIVVQFIAVDMMDDFARPERSTKHFLGNYPVFMTAIEFAVGPALAATALQFAPALCRCASSAFAMT